MTLRMGGSTRTAIFTKLRKVTVFSHETNTHSNRAELMARTEMTYPIILKVGWAKINSSIDVPCKIHAHTGCFAI